MYSMYHLLYPQTYTFLWKLKRLHIDLTKHYYPVYKGIFHWVVRSSFLGILTQLCNLFLPNFFILNYFLPCRISPTEVKSAIHPAPIPDRYTSGTYRLLTSGSQSKDAFKISLKHLLALTNYYYFFISGLFLYIYFDAISISRPLNLLLSFMSIPLFVLCVLSSF